MKVGFQQYLLDKGYKPYRRLHNDDGEPYYGDLKLRDFSTMVSGGLDIRYIKDDDFDNQIIYGLSEFRKPPTLIYPRPGMYKKVEGGVKYYNDDNSMNKVLGSYTHEEIYEAIYNREIALEIK